MDSAIAIEKPNGGTLLGLCYRACVVNDLHSELP